jgi:glycine oxidase
VLGRCGVKGTVQSRADVVVIGGGVIGLAIAWRCARVGLTVTVCDEQPGRGASWAAAGMLAPVTEAHYGEEALLALNLASARRWPSFAVELQDAGGIDVGLRTDGTLAVAYDDDDLTALDELGRFQAELGLSVERLRGRECRSLEPLLHPRIRGGLLVCGDHQVDNRRLVAALLAAIRERGVELVAAQVAEVEVSAGHAIGVRLAGGARVTAGAVVVAAGCWSGELRLPEAATPPVRPVKGQILRLQAGAATPVPQHSVRGLARGRSVYVVPRAGGEVVVGATVEELGFDTRVTADAVHDLLSAAIDVVPGIAELELGEALARLRPGTPDNAPILGPTDVDGLVMATGHYRNGILLAPVTADAITALVADGVWKAVVEPFTLARFR